MAAHVRGPTVDPDGGARGGWTRLGQWAAAHPEPPRALQPRAGHQGGGAVESA